MNKYQAITADALCLIEFDRVATYCHEDNIDKCSKGMIIYELGNYRGYLDTCHNDVVSMWELENLQIILRRIPESRLSKILMLMTEARAQSAKALAYGIDELVRDL